jgi:integrase/recombinase XerC
LASGVADRIRGPFNGDAFAGATPAGSGLGDPTAVKKHPRLAHLAPLIDEFIAVSETIWSEATKKKHRKDFDRFLRWLDEEGHPATTASLSFPMLLAYVSSLLARCRVHGVWRGDPIALAVAQAASKGDTISRNTVWSYMSPLRTLCTYLSREGALPQNPFEKGRERGRANPLLPKEETPAKAATLVDFEILERGAAGSKAIDLRDQAVISLLKTTAARNSSVRLLRLQDVDMTQNVITFRRAKGDKTYQVALHPETKAAIARYLSRGRSRLFPPYPVRGFEDARMGADEGWVFIARDNGRAHQRVGPLTASGLSQMLTERYQKGGGPPGYFGSHRLRHGSATLLANNGMPIDELSRFMGHSSTIPTRRYAPQSSQALGALAHRAMDVAGLTGWSRRGGNR